MWARINNNEVAELADIDPAGRFHPEMVWVPCTEDVQIGYQYLDGIFSPLPSRQIGAQQLKESVTQRRWQVEVGGITLPSGIRVATGIDDQNRITSVVANAERAAVDSVDFKAESGWVRVTLAELQGITAAIARHVQACFSAERTHHEAIDALVAQHQGDAQALQEVLDSYDESQGWPVG